MKNFAIACVLFLGVGIFASAVWYSQGAQEKSVVAPLDEVVSTSSAISDLSKDYTNDTYHFSLKLPESFSIRDLQGSDDGNTIVFEDGAGSGIQIIISPFDEDTGDGYTLTKERILQDVPDMTISEPQPVEVGIKYVGLAFKSDNEQYDGASREVWFVFRGNLYQISTYERFDSLLKAIFATWKFE